MPPNNSTTPGPITTNGTGGSAVGPNGEVVAAPNASNGSVVWTDGGAPVQVEQGPRWLVELAYNPPGWLDVALVAAIVVVLVLVTISVKRNGISHEARRDALRNLTTVAGAAMLTMLVMSVADFRYGIDVLVGGLGGSMLGMGVFEYLATRYDATRSQTDTEVNA